MPGQGFQLMQVDSSDPENNLQYIYHPGSGLKINVYPIFYYPFSPKATEMCFYGQLFQWWHAFETENIKEHQEDLIAPALTWYAERMFYPQMRPQLIDPRPKRSNAFVN